jgi:hypothetical protein
MLNWGGSDAPVSIYIVGTQRIEVRSSAKLLTRMYITGGFGHGRFGPLYSSGVDFGAFWSISTDLAPSTEGFFEWTGQDFGLGLSVALNTKLPLLITPALIDLLGSAGRARRFYLAVSSGITFR